jgi:hypothetical protein
MNPLTNSRVLFEKLTANQLVKTLTYTRLCLEADESSPASQKLHRSGNLEAVKLVSDVITVLSPENGDFLVCKPLTFSMCTQIRNRIHKTMHNSWQNWMHNETFSSPIYQKLITYSSVA